MKNTIFDFARKYCYVILGGLGIVVIGVVYILSRGQSVGVINSGEIIFSADAEQQVEVADVFDAEVAEVFAEEEPAKKIMVHLVGEVNNPGVYELDEGARVDCVIKMAGGETENADLSRINLAAFLRDAMQIIVPAIGDDTSDVFIYENPPSDENYSAAGGLVNINTATVEELQTLPGVGPVMAQNIIDTRNARGNFISTEDLLNVSRIGAATLERLRPLVTVGD